MDALALRPMTNAHPTDAINDHKQNKAQALYPAWFVGSHCRPQHTHLRTLRIARSTLSVPPHSTTDSIGSWPPLALTASAWHARGYQWHRGKDKQGELTAPVWPLAGSSRVRGLTDHWSHCCAATATEPTLVRAGPIVWTLAEGPPSQRHCTSLVCVARVKVSNGEQLERLAH